MARRRFLSSVAVSVLVLLQAVTPAPTSAKDSGSLGPLPVAISAEFDHSPQLGTYRTHLNSVNPIAFTGDQAGGMTALFLMEPADCFGIVSWAMPGNQSHAVGPAAICLANSVVTEGDFNDWIDRGKKSGVDPRLTLVLGPPQPSEPPQPGQTPLQTRSNAGRVSVQVFLRGCNATSFHKHADLVFEKGTLAFTFWTDSQGASHVSLAAAPVFMEKQDSATWGQIREGCDAAKVLPPSPSDGQSTSFAGTSVSQPPDPSTVSGQFSLLGGQINGLVFQRRLVDKSADSLLRQLDKAMTDLQDTRPDQAARELQHFRDGLANLTKKGLIDIAGAKSLMDGALGIETFLSDRASVLPPPPDPALYCSGDAGPCPDTLSSCTFTPLYVDGASRDRAPDGSSKHPFATLGGALGRAAAMKVCGVNLMVAPARYAGPIEITRHTRILGQRAPGTSATPIIEGSVTNRGPFLLELQLVTLSWYRDELSDGVFVDHPCAITRFDTVAVRGYRGFGVRQRGGSLRAQSAIVADTRAQPASLAQGTGMLLTCGVAADLVDVVIDSNESAGLLIASPGTRVQAFVLTVEGTRVHPAYADVGTTSFPWGAVHVRDHAHLDAISFDIRRNLLAGAFVDNGGEAVLDHGTIADTWSMGRLFPAQRDAGGGINAFAIRGGHLRMSNFNLTRADLCGIEVAFAGEMDLGGTPIHSSVVSQSPIGACVSVPDYDLSRLMDNVAYQDNGVNLQAVSLPPPGALTVLDP